jgi:FlaA1/EpsC-like NDP-sugar epimerase
MKYRSLKKFTDEDILGLLGRKERKIELKNINERVLVTGGAGSIGSELARKLISLNAEVLIVDWYENGLFQISQELGKQATYKIADVKSPAMKKILKDFKPKTIIHASAYKHVPLMQENPLEAFNNNVGGVMNMIKLSKAENFVLVSTDKAVNPSSYMGMTKRLCELIVENAGGISVRFGNVIQSNGSVVNTWLKQIEDGKNLTVTHKKIRRYFMSKNEAVSLILKAKEIGEQGSIYWLDMGQLYSIYELAEKLIEKTKSDSGIEIVGLRKGEKMIEELDMVKEKTEDDSVYKIKECFKNKKRVPEILEKFLAKSLQHKVGDKDVVYLFKKLGL